jgi:hypothetical protein
MNSLLFALGCCSFGILAFVVATSFSPTDNSASPTDNWQWIPSKISIAHRSNNCILSLQLPRHTKWLETLTRVRLNLENMPSTSNDDDIQDHWSATWLADQTLQFQLKRELLFADSSNAPTRDQTNLLTWSLSSSLDRSKQQQHQASCVFNAHCYAAHCSMVTSLSSTSSSTSSPTKNTDTGKKDIDFTFNKLLKNPIKDDDLRSINAITQQQKRWFPPVVNLMEEHYYSLASHSRIDLVNLWSTLDSNTSFMQQPATIVGQSKTITKEMQYLRFFCSVEPAWHKSELVFQVSLSSIGLTHAKCVLYPGETRSYSTVTLPVHPAAGTLGSQLENTLFVSFTFASLMKSNPQSVHSEPSTSDQYLLAWKLIV